MRVLFVLWDWHAGPICRRPAKRGQLLLPCTFPETVAIPRDAAPTQLPLSSQKNPQLSKIHRDGVLVTRESRSSSAPTKIHRVMSDHRLRLANIFLWRVAFASWRSYLIMRIGCNVNIYMINEDLVASILDSCSILDENPQSNFSYNPLQSLKIWHQKTNNRTPNCEKYVNLNIYTSQ